MAKATAHITCDECGKQFTREQTFGNRRDADNWTEYVERAGGLCTECYRKQQQARNADKASAYTLPEITGKSEKQIAYATDVRNRYVARNAKGIEMALRVVDGMKDAEKLAGMKSDAEKDGVKFEEWLDGALRDYGIRTEYDAVTMTEARDIIDELKYL